MTSKTTLALAGARLFALAQTATAAEPVTLDDDRLDELTASALPDIVIWDIDGGEGPSGPAGSSTGVVRLRVAF